MFYHYIYTHQHMMNRQQHLQLRIGLQGMRQVQRLLMNMRTLHHNTCMWITQLNFNIGRWDSSQLPLFDSVQINRQRMQSTILSRRYLIRSQSKKWVCLSNSYCLPGKVCILFASYKANKIVELSSWCQVKYSMDQDRFYQQGSQCKFISLLMDMYLVSKLEGVNLDWDI